MSQVTTHVLDTALGVPAAGVPVTLEQQVGGEWVRRATSVTDSDGRVAELGGDPLDPGTYRIGFDTSAYFQATGQTAFFPEVSVAFTVSDARHYHVPLLLSPFGYSTYRGS